mmetsp:Transcript_26368/g.83505  ORF Transcript_26368/g.83505 Transcript_26368/m.83505 type:complete len:644 (-) Transcript_26368:42-1973(-)
MDGQADQVATLLTAPLRIVDTLFAQRLAATGTAPEEWGEREHFVRALGLDDEERFQQIPCLNDAELRESVPPFSLVRYRGLVQDIFEPEIYAATLEERPTAALPGAPARLVTTKYRECVEPAAGCCLEDLGREGLGQRGACYCVPLPGETAWARAASALASAAARPPALASEAVRRATAPVTPPPLAVKRPRPDEDVNMTPDEPCDPRESRRPRTAPAPGAGPAAGRPGVGASGMSRSAEEFGLNFPLPWEERQGQGASTAVIVKLYDRDMEALRLCESVEVLGILCVDPLLANFQPAPLDDARQPSSSFVPRLHAILVRRLPFHHPLLPFTPSWLSEARLVAAYQSRLSAPGVLAAARAAALEQLRRHLGGDALAAEYVLMLLVSRAFGKHGEQSLGCWALNLLSWPDGASAKALGEAAAELVPRAACLELTAEALGSQRWRPRKDFEANRLVAAQLQLSPGTLLLLDETQMGPGQLPAEGARALVAVGALVTEQNLTCDYTSYDVKIPLELSCLLVSRRRSIIKEVDVAVPLRPTEPLLASAAPVEPGSLDAARFLLGLVTRQPKPLRIPNEVAEVFGRDFAAARQEFQVRPELCHSWMSLARARCLTLAEDELTADGWAASLQLERERLRRCAEEGILGS